MNAPSKAGRQPAVHRFHLDIDDGPFRFSERHKYIMLVLWVIGLSAGTIARVIPTTRKRALNYLTRGPFAGRSFMTDGERRAHLRELKSIRFEDGVQLDGGLLDNIDWTVRPLDGRKIKPSRKAVVS